MPERVDECVESVLDDNPQMPESRAWAICHAQFNGRIADPVAKQGVLRLVQQADIPETLLEETELTEDDFVPNADVAAAAQEAIDYVDEHGLPNPDDQREGIARAHQLVDHHNNDEPLAPAFWEEIRNFHARHRAQDNHQCDESEYDPCMADPGVFSDHTWGSDAGLEQAERITDAMADVETKLAQKDEDPCWEGYEMVGTKVVNGETVPNCVPEDAVDKLSPRQKATACTGVDVVGPAELEVGQKQRNEIDEDSLPEEYQEALEADDFIVYGKASIEQYDVEDQRISIDALEAALDRFFGSEDAPGIISRGHADVPVGTPVREHTLDADTTLVIDGERYEYEAGDTLRTETKDADDDELPELWLVSRLANDSELARETRLRVLQGELNGYSVTVYPREVEKAQAGEDVTAVDLHAVTIGTDEQIKNKGSEFDVAEFKALDSVSAAASRMAETVQKHLTMTNEDNEKTLLARILKRSGEELEQEAQTDGGDAATAADGDAGDGESLASPIYAAVEDGDLSAEQAAKLDDVAEKMDEGVVKPLIDAISEDDLDVDQAVDMLSAMGMGGGGESPKQQGDMPDDEDDDEEEKADTDADDADATQKADAKEVAKEIADRFDIPVDEVMEHLDALEMEADSKDEAGELKAAAAEAASKAAADKLDEAVEEAVDEAVEAKLDDALPDAIATEDDIEAKLDEAAERVGDEVEEALQKADTTSTPSPLESEGDSGKTLGDVVAPSTGGDD